MRHGAPFQALPSICSPPCWHSNHISSPYHSSLQTRFLSSLEEGQRNSISSCVEACASNTLRVRIWLGYRHKREVWISTFTAQVHRFYCYPVLICNLTKPITSVLLLYASVCVCVYVCVRMNDTGCFPKSRELLTSLMHHRFINKNILSSSEAH